jgi:hypothetical protein
MDNSPQSNSNKKEITNGIVSDIKNKIQSFKKKKNSEKMIPRENELDIEVNIDLLNKFKKPKGGIIQMNDESKEEKSTFKKKEIFENNTPSNLGHRKFEQLKNEINFSPKLINNKNERKVINTNISTNIIASDEKIDRDIVNNYNKMINNVNARPFKTFLVSEESFDRDLRNKSDDK